LSAFLRGFLNGLLGLFLGAHEEHALAFAHGVREKIAGGFELAKRFAEVDDVDAVASIEDKRLHLGIPPFGLVAEMNAGVQQFLNADTNHNISFG
jgi:hypothetical protein